MKVLGRVDGTQDWTFVQSAPFVLPPMPASSVSLCLALDFSAAAGTACFDDLDLSGKIVPEPASLLLALGALALLPTRVRGR